MTAARPDQATTGCAICFFVSKIGERPRSL